MHIAHWQDPKHCQTIKIQLNFFFESKIQLNFIVFVFKLGVSMFNPTREHDTNPTQVFSG